MFEDFENFSYANYDKALVIRSTDALKKVTRGYYCNFITITTYPEVEKELGSLPKKSHTIIIRPKGLLQGDPNISLGILNYETFSYALFAMGMNEQEVERYSRESGKSLTVLRRRLSKNPAVRFPEWVQDNGIVRKMIPFILVGAWDSNIKADLEVLQHLSDDKCSKNIEIAITTILKLEQSPLWRVGNFCGVTSKIDALFAIKGFMISGDIETFIEVIGNFLGKVDPALDLPEDMRWAAPIYQKNREHSNALRMGLCETLVLLSVFDNELFQDSNISIKSKVDKLIRDLLQPFNPTTWLSQKDELPIYAEAAPDTFLSIIEDDLKNDNPKIFELLKSSTGIFGGCPRAGLLWALELLAWKSTNLVRVVWILARLAERKIDDNWQNKPVNSLRSIFSYITPQTAATSEERQKALEFLVKKSPNIGWQVCNDQFSPIQPISCLNKRPKWRNDAIGVVQCASQAEIFAFRRKALDLALNWSKHDENTLGGLIAGINIILFEDTKKVWELIKTWNNSGISDQQRVILRNRIRHYAIKSRVVSQEIKNDAKEIYNMLVPEDPVYRHQWIFSHDYVESLEGFEEDFDYNRQVELIDKQRVEALQEIFITKGILGIKQFILRENKFSIGRYLSKVIKSDVTFDLFDEILSDFSINIKEINIFIPDFLRSQESNDGKNFIEGLISKFETENDIGENKILRLLIASPFNSDTWSFVDKLPDDLQKKYWTEVTPERIVNEYQDFEKIIDKFLKVKRPRAALFSIWLKYDQGLSGSINTLA